jgi:hypothetical protein
MRKSVIFFNRDIGLEYDFSNKGSIITKGYASTKIHGEFLNV